MNKDTEPDLIAESPVLMIKYSDNKRKDYAGKKQNKTGFFRRKNRSKTKLSASDIYLTNIIFLICE